MSDLARELSDKEIRRLVTLIAGPTFKYMMRRINNTIILDKKQSDLSINSFISVLVIAIASIDANALRWIERFYKIKIGQDIDFEKLKLSLTKNLAEQLGIELH